MKLNKTILTLISILTLTSQGNADIKIKENSMKFSLTSASISKSGNISTNDSDNKGFALEYRAITTDPDLPVFYVGLNKYSDRVQGTFKVGYEHFYKKVDNLTPFTSISAGGIYSKWSDSPMKDKDTEDETATSLLVSAEAGAYFQENTFASISLNIYNIETDLNYLGNTGSIDEKNSIHFSIGYLF